MNKDQHQIIIGLPDTILGRLLHDLDLALGVSGAIRFAKWAVPTSVAVATVIAPQAVLEAATNTAKFVGNKAAEGAVHAGGYIANKTIEGAGYLAENAPAYVLDKTLKATAFIGDKAIEGADYLAENAPGYIADKSAYLGGKMVQGAAYVAENAPGYIADKASYLGEKAAQGAVHVAGVAIDYAKENSTAVATAASVAALATASYIGYGMYNESVQRQKEQLKQEKERIEKEFSDTVRVTAEALNQDIQESFVSLTDLLKKNQTLPMFRLEKLSKDFVDTYNKNAVIDQEKLGSINKILTETLSDLPKETLKEVENKVMSLIGAITLHEHFQERKRENKVDRSFVDKIKEERSQGKQTGRNLAE